MEDTPQMTVHDMEEGVARTTMSATDAARTSAEAALLRMLEADDKARVPLNELQRACMRVPQLSTFLTGAQRYLLYSQLLLLPDEVAKTPQPPDTFAAFADKANETHAALADALARVLGDDTLTTADLRGFVFYFSSKTSAYVNDEFVAATLMLATMLHDAKAAQGQALLRLLYRFLYVVHADFLVPNASRQYEKVAANLLSLMLQYHDPALSVHLAHNKVNAGQQMLHWARALFAINEGYTEALCIMDWVFILGDPVMLPYVALAYLVSHRSHFLGLHSQETLEAALREAVLRLPTRKDDAVDPHLIDGRQVALVPVWGGKSLLQNAELLFRNTPLSTQRVLEFSFYPENGQISQTPEALQAYYEASPCLPLERADFATSFATRQVDAAGDGTPSRLEYIIVDCRSRTSYDYARLPTAVFVGDVVGFDTHKLDEVVRRVASAKGSHITVFGTGRAITEEQNLLKMLSFHLVAQAFPYVSYAPGGFKAIIPLIRSHAIRIVQQDETGMTGGFAPGNFAANTTQAIASALSGLGELLPHTPPDREAVLQRAEEIKNKAKEGVSVAAAWGWDVVHKVQEKLAEGRGQETRRQADPTAVQRATVVEQPVEGPLLRGRVSGTPVTTRPAPPRQLFSLGDEEGDDDFELITSMPPRPLKGVQLTATEAVPTTNCTQPTSKTAAVTASSTTAVANAIPTTMTAATTTDVTRPLTEKVTDATTSNIVASIDAEFDELFGKGTTAGAASKGTS